LQGVEALLGCCSARSKKVLLPALWALRNLSHDNATTKNKIGATGGVESMLRLCSEQMRDGGAVALGKEKPPADRADGAGEGTEGTESTTGGDPEVLEASLAVLLNLCIDHERNCRKLLMSGIDTLIQIAEAGAGASEKPEDQDGQRYGSTNSSLAADLLQLVGPFNFILCGNGECGHRNAGGTTCEMCGYPISFEIG
jgi:hypothetical protein